MKGHRGKGWYLKGDVPQLGFLKMSHSRAGLCADDSDPGEEKSMIKERKYMIRASKPWEEYGSKESVKEASSFKS